jgi:formylglycine-generating enzyme required for sulfatase activity
MTYLPAATFTMGSNDKKNKKYWLESEGEAEWPGLDEPIHKVSLNAFCMDTTEVTVTAYRACMRNGKCATPGEERCAWPKPEMDNHPMDCLTWTQADHYCRAMGKLLPSEEQWEYGARGTDRRRYPWGNQDPHYEDHGYEEFCNVSAGGPSCPVGQYKRVASPFGLLDMAGNLKEWTSSEYCESGGVCSKIVRGAGGPTLGELRSAHRDYERVSMWSSTLGFRCALPL